MAPSRKSRSVNKRFSYINEGSPEKFGENGSKSRQKKRKFTDMLGPQWSKEELQRFYEAYRKYGKDWRKVATMVHNRSVDMVEALYTMNRAYLSLPEGTASVVGLIAMMTDHYCVLGGSDSEESNEGSGATRKPQKQACGKLRSNNSRGLEGNFGEVSTSSYGCLSLLKKRRSGIKPHAVGKRTPRVPVSFSYDKDNKDKYVSPARQDLKPKIDADDDVTHEIALALTEASQRGDSQTPNQKAEDLWPSHVRTGDRVRSESEMTSAKLRCSEMDDRGSTGADNADYDRGKGYLISRESAGPVEVQQKGKRYHKKKLEVDESVNNHLDDIKEAYSGTEEGQKLVSVKSSLKGLRKRSKKVLLGGDESPAFDALQALADLSLMMPGTTIDSESSAKGKEAKLDVVDKFKLKGSHSIVGAEVTASKTSKTTKVYSHNIDAIPEAKDRPPPAITGTRKRKMKISPFKIFKNDAHSNSLLSESQKIEAIEEGNKSFSKGIRSPHNAGPAKPGKSVKAPEHLSSSSDHRREENDSALLIAPVPSANQVTLHSKVRSKRKTDHHNFSMQKDAKSSVKSLADQSKPLHDRLLYNKGKLSNCLSLHQVRRWCACEWFYSAIDYPWFAKCEFVEYLNHVGLDHIPRLTRVEWSVIRSSLGRPRRFSQQFLKEEKQKLNLYRETVRQHYAEVRAGTREGLPTDLAQPLSVGQRVVAVHPRTWEIYDGSVLTVDYSRCRVQFDQPELGVEFVMDIDCIPVNPMENLPASVIRQSFSFECFDKFFGYLDELKINAQLKEGKIGDFLKSAPNVNLEKSDGHTFLSPSAHHVGKLLKQSKVDLTSPNLLAKFGTYTQQVVNSQPSVLPQFQAKEADVQALSELTRFLDKKEALVSELRRMNDEVSENQKYGDHLLKDCEYFKKQYAAILLLLNEVNEQVSYALFCLRQRNTYQGTSQPMLLNPVADLGDPGFQAQEHGSHVTEIVEGSRTKARKMVEVAIQAMSTMKNGENNIETIEEAIDFVNNKVSIDDLALPATKSANADAKHVTLACSQNNSNSCPPNPVETSQGVDPNSNSASEQRETEIPSELITHCVATLLMIQKCTERQFPPAEVAQVLDSAVNRLQPCCSQNLPIYAEIHKCMGIIRSQILALIPT